MWSFFLIHCDNVSNRAGGVYCDDESLVSVAWNATLHNQCPSVSQIGGAGSLKRFVIPEGTGSLDEAFDFVGRS